MEGYRTMLKKAKNGWLLIFKDGSMVKVSSETEVIKAFQNDEVMSAYELGDSIRVQTSIVSNENDYFKYRETQRTWLNNELDAK